jgi:hypothetical protein
MNRKNAWIGIDFDGTLAKTVTHVWNGPLGPPIPKMVRRVKKWLKMGIEVRIFTARVSPLNENGVPQSDWQMKRLRFELSDWCEQHLGKRLVATNQKDHNIIMIVDDKCEQVIRDTGKRVGRTKWFRKLR